MTESLISLALGAFIVLLRLTEEEARWRRLVEFNFIEQVLIFSKTSIIQNAMQSENPSYLLQNHERERRIGIAPFRG